MASASAVSLPGLMKKCLSEAAPVRLRRGSMVYSLAPVAPRLHDERPQVHVGAENVGAPGQNQPRVAELLRLGAVAQAQRFGEPRLAGRRADGAVQARSAQAMKEAAIHALAVEQPHGAGVAVGQDGFGPEFLARWRAGGGRWCRALRPRRCARSVLRPWRPRAAGDRAGGRANIRAPGTAPLSRIGNRA